ncbi:hypothetical protein H632_c3570p0 [Helicosporidium sp. ATCC 50920]|nr:hypothetical protein H632_c3570p0 [Helicosporidium sp. ATCC 50920]|eukprot:KDD72293.1 hypothetical protein H632_c3570p0 [Helicosporidium sp. ATCC 50920]
MRPDTTYSGGVTFKGTGLKFSSDAAVIKDTIALLKQKNPHTKVLVSVGGNLVYSWDLLNAPAIANFVQTFGLDGVDIKYEPITAECHVWDGMKWCDTEYEYTYIIRTLRAALPRPYILANAVLPVGAYGEGDWASARPLTKFNGFAIGPLKLAGKDLDLLLLMAHNAGAYNALELDFREASAAYASVFGGDILLGVQLVLNSWGGRQLSLAQVDSLTDHVKSKRMAGMVIFPANKRPEPGPPMSNPNFQRICTNLDLEDCDVPLVL